MNTFPTETPFFVGSIDCIIEPEAGEDFEVVETAADEDAFAEFF